MYIWLKTRPRQVNRLRSLTRTFKRRECVLILSSRLTAVCDVCNAERDYSRNNTLSGSFGICRHFWYIFSFWPSCLVWRDMMILVAPIISRRSVFHPIGTRQVNNIDPTVLNVHNVSNIFGSQPLYRTILWSRKLYKRRKLFFFLPWKLQVYT